MTTIKDDFSHLQFSNNLDVPTPVKDVINETLKHNMAVKCAFKMLFILRIIMAISVFLFGVVLSIKYYNVVEPERQEGIRKIWLTWVGASGILPLLFNLLTQIFMTILVNTIIDFIVKKYNPLGTAHKESKDTTPCFSTLSKILFKGV